MKKIFFWAWILPVFISCSNRKNDLNTTKDKKIILRSDVTNKVKLTDTMVINESVCRGCAFEESTWFSIHDSLGLVELDHVETFDHNDPDTDGGYLNKKLLIVPRKTGTTTIRMYKFWEQPPTAEDSVNYTSYTIEVKN